MPSCYHSHFAYLPALNHLKEKPGQEQANSSKHKPTDNLNCRKHQGNQYQCQSTQHQTYYNLCENSDEIPASKPNRQPTQDDCRQNPKNSQHRARHNDTSRLISFNKVYVILLYYII